MKNLQTFEEFLNEAVDKWTLSSDGSPTMYRFSGKTFPQIMYSSTDKKIYARDDNGKNVSKTLETSDISISGMKKLLGGISTPHPIDSTMEEFLKRIK